MKLCLLCFSLVKEREREMNSSARKSAQTLRKDSNKFCSCRTYMHLREERTLSASEPYISKCFFKYIILQNLTNLHKKEYRLYAHSIIIRDIDRDIQTSTAYAQLYTIYTLHFSSIYVRIILFFANFSSMILWLEKFCKNRRGEKYIILFQKRTQLNIMYIM